MMMRRLLTLLAFIALPVFAATSPADDPPLKKEPPPKPWRPYKEIPEVLYFESFEGEGPGIWSIGTIQDKVVQTPGSHSLKLAAYEEKEQTTRGEASLAALGSFHLMGGLRPSDIKFQFMIWAEAPGKVVTSMGDDAKGWYSETTSVGKGQTWTTISMDLAELYNGHQILRETGVLNQIRIVFKPNTPKQTAAFIDELVLVNVLRPPEVMPHLLSVENKRSEVFRMAPRDGFAFNYYGQELLQNAVKAPHGRRKAKTVLVLASRPEDTEPLKAALAAAQTKAKSDFHFVFAEAPDGSPVAGLDDMHTLLQYNLQKSEAEMALLVLGRADVADGTTPGSETIRVIQERALESGVVPIVCAVPPGMTSVAKDRTNLDRLYSAAITASRMTGAPWVDIAFTYKDNAAALDKGELSAVGLASLADLSIKTLRHMDQFVFGRK